MRYLMFKLLFKSLNKDIEYFLALQRREALIANDDNKDYMVGMFNGMEYVKSLITGETPEYITAKRKTKNEQNN